MAGPVLPIAMIGPAHKSPPAREPLKGERVRSLVIPSRALTLSQGLGGEMAIVTVEEAASRLGVSVATVRRRLGRGQLAGSKVGRDWQVDEAALPSTPLRAASAPTPFSNDEIRRAIRYVSGTDLAELWVPDVLRWADYLSDPDRLVKQVRARIAGDVRGQAVEVRIPKNALATRAGTLIDLIDCLVYQTAVGRVAPKIEAATSERVLSARLSSDPRYFFLRSSEQYVKWQRAGLEQAKSRNGLLVSTDLSSFFDTIDQPTLIRELEELTDETYAIDILRRQFRSWSLLQHRGIPQGPNASRLLGNAYLLPVDEHMLTRGYDYWRYMDDVVIVVADQAEAARAVSDFERACNRRGLLVSSAKTEVQTPAEMLKASGSSLKRDVEYLMQRGPSQARKALMKIFSTAVPSKGRIDISDAKFSVWRLAQSLDRGPLRRMLDRVADLGPIATVSAAYLRHFLTTTRTVQVVGDFLNDPDRNTSDYFESWLFAACLEYPGKVPERWTARARTVALNRNSTGFHRVLAMNLLALGGKTGDVIALRRLATQEHDPEIVRGAIVALARVGKLDKPTETAVAARHPSLVLTLTHLKSRRNLPSLVYRGRSVPIIR